MLAGSRMASMESSCYTIIAGEQTTTILGAEDRDTNSGGGILGQVCRGECRLRRNFSRFSIFRIRDLYGKSRQIFEFKIVTCKVL